MNLNPFKKPANDPLPEWSNAASYVANGYALLPLEKWWANQEPHPAVDALQHESPMGGNYAWGLPAPVHGADEFTVAIQGGRLPREGGWSMAEYRASWLCVVKLSPMNRRQLRDVLPLLAGSLLRTDTRNGNMLALFRAGKDVPDPREFGRFERNAYAEAKGTACLLPRAPWLTWHEGRSPLNVRCDELAAVENADHERELMRAIEAAVGVRAA